jgi:NADP-dependent 3-hydroxy acid dehydrogenase YdfG
VSAPLAGRAALVSGASSGIGLAIAESLAGAGARVALLARRADRLAAAAQEIGAGAIAVPCDVTDAAAVARAVEHVRGAFGDLPDILVNNAGIFAPAPLARMDAAHFRDTLEVNLVAPFLLLRAILPRLLERKAGHVVTIGSTADRVAFPGSGAYGASKAGARMMHEVLRAELRGTGVRATLVSPASVDTDIWHDVDPDVVRTPPAKAMLAAEDVARAVLYAVTQEPTVNVDELRLSRA